MHNMGHRCGICGSFFLSHSLSRSQVFNFLKWKHPYLSKNIAIFHSNDDFFTQYLFMYEKRCHLMTFSWRLESQRTRARGKSNHKFRAIKDPKLILVIHPNMFNLILYDFLAKKKVVHTTYFPPLTHIGMSYESKKNAHF